MTAVLATGTSFGAAIAEAAGHGELVVQPRMGFADPRRMRAGLAATASAAATTVATITLDSYTRVGDHAAAKAALAEGTALNGYPIVDHPAALTRSLVDSVTVPVQVRHGSATPWRIVGALADAGLAATEGGPVSYCLPYGRTPLRESVTNWARACELLAARTVDPHLETFGGCLLGQLCPPSLLVALSVLEALFFTRHGVRSVSLSYAQQTDADQDAEAVAALRTLATEHLPAHTDWHVVLYAYMGVYPRTAHGARALLTEAARLAVRTGTERLIVKTAAESDRIPTIAENVTALEVAAAAARCAPGPRTAADTGVLAEARALVGAVLDLHPDLGRALTEAFALGVLDVPFCLHPDNAGAARGVLCPDGRLRWSAVGRMPIRADRSAPAMTSTQLITALHHVARRFDQ